MALFKRITSAPLIALALMASAPAFSQATPYIYGGAGNSGGDRLLNAGLGVELGILPLIRPAVEGEIFHSDAMQGISVNALARVPLLFLPGVSPFVKAGVSEVDVKHGSGAQAGTVVGVGSEFLLLDWRLRATYDRHEVSDNANFNVWSFGLQYDF